VPLTLRRYWQPAPSPARIDATTKTRKQPHVPEVSNSKKSLVILYTGDGKGKTTAALGIMMRARGRGLRVLMLAFIKSPTRDYGEQHSADKLGAEFTPVGRGFTWLSDDIEKDKEMALFGWRRAKREIASGMHDVVILDELTYPLAFDWLPLDEILDVLRERPAHVHVVITGRRAPQRLIDFADLVTEMREVKHPFTQDVPAIPGIDF
jgi:cob(I)alamin adenosyltransferase